MRSASAAEWREWAMVPASHDPRDTTRRPATDPELPALGVERPHTDPATGTVYFHAVGGDRVYPGTAHTPEHGPDAYLAQRHRALPAEHKARFYCARVFRAGDGSNLRTDCEAGVAAVLEAYTPATGRTSSQPADPTGAVTVLEEARRRATPEIGPDGSVTRAATARAIFVPMAEVEDGDVVEEDALIGHRWQGEPER